MNTETNNNSQAANNNIISKVYKDIDAPEIKVQPEPIQHEAKKVEPEKEEHPEPELSEDINYMIFYSSHPDIDIILTPTKRNTVIQVKFKGKVNGTNVKARSLSELMDISKNYDTKIIRMIMQVTGIERKKAKSITNKFMSEVGNMDFKLFEQIIERTNMFEIDLNQFCDETIKREMVEKAIDLANDGNSKKYIKQIIRQKYNSLDNGDAIEIADIALNLRYTQIKVIDPNDFFYGEKNNILNVQSLGRHIMNLYHFKTIGKLGIKDIYVYQDGVYIRRGRSTIKKMVNDILEHRVKKDYRNEVLEYIEVETEIERDELNNDIYLINLENGIYDVESGNFIEHNPEILSTIRIPVNYDPKAECPQIDKFLSEVVSEEDKITLIEYIGYCLIPDVRMQKALLVYGSGSNGKSILLNLINKIIGGANASGVPLQKLMTDKFAAARLFRKLVNICPDIPASKLISDSVFKTLVAGIDMVNGEEKFKESFEFFNKARLIFSANHLPEPPNDPKDNYAYYRRWILIPFPNNFEGKEDKQLLEKLTTEKEKSGFLNILLEGLHTVLKNGRFTYEKSVAEIEKIYLANLNPIDTFFDECIVTGCSDGITKQDMFDAYSNWCKEHYVTSDLKYQSFCTILTNEKQLQSGRSGHKNVSTWYYVGFKKDYPGGNIKKLKLCLTDDEEVKKPYNGLGDHFDTNFNNDTSVSA